MTGISPIEPPDDCMYATAEAVTVTLAVDPGGSLNFGLLISASPPLGTIRVKMFREQVAALRDQLNEMASLSTDEVAEFMTQLRGQQHENTDPEGKEN